MQNQSVAVVVRKYGLVSSLLSAAFAGAMLAAPRRMAGHLSLPKSDSLMRWLAARDLLIGATLLNESLRRRGLAMRGVADATDAALILTSSGRGQKASPASRTKAALALSGAVCALCLAFGSRAEA